MGLHKGDSVLELLVPGGGVMVEGKFVKVNEVCCRGDVKEVICENCG